MSKDLIRYDLLVQDALKGVVRKVLGSAAKDGLPGDHHFYVSFRTDFPGVRLSPRLREKYPEDMTIVLQHQFWDLSITEQHLEVGLSFSGVPERLFIPLDAVTGFFDPSVQFGLKFEIHDEAGTDAGDKPAKGRGGRIAEEADRSDAERAQAARQGGEAGGRIGQDGGQSRQRPEARQGRQGQGRRRRRRRGRQPGRLPQEELTVLHHGFSALAR